MSEQFFGGLRPRLAFGRGFEPGDHRVDSEPVAVISYRMWQSRFGGQRDIIGTGLEVTRDPRVAYTAVQRMESNGRTVMGMVPGTPEQETTQFRIVGVMADTLGGLTQAETALWVPIERAYSLYLGSVDLLRAFPGGPRTYIRKRSGIDTAAILEELEARYGGEESLFNSLLRLDAIDGVVSDIDVQRDANRQLSMFLAGSMLLALAAAANVSLFLLARAPGRRRELGIRMAVGARIGRLTRQLATEAGLLVAASAALGLLISVWLSTLLRSLALLRDAEWRQVTLLDWRVVGLAGIFLLVLTLLVSLAPVLGMNRLGIAANSRQVTSRASLAQRIAGTAQIAVAGALGAAAIAFGWHLGTLLYGDPGYALNDRHVVRFEVPEDSGIDQRRAIVEMARQRDVIEAIPGVDAVAFATVLPADGQAGTLMQIADPNDAANEIEVRWGTFDSRLIEVLGLRLAYGRAPEGGEHDVVVINQTLARTWWGHEDVVGEPLPFRVYYTSDGPEVIGVLEDLSFEHPAQAVLPIVFSPNINTTFGKAVVATSLPAGTLQEELDRAAAAGDLEIRVTGVQPLRALRNELIAPDRARGLLTLATAVLVVFLSGFGFYGTQRYLVSAGRREYAIRASLGAGPRALGRLVVWRGLLLGLPGLVTGGLLAFIAVAWLRGDVVVRAISPALVTGWVALGLVFLLLAASLAPAREARRTQPAPLLRED